MARQLLWSFFIAALLVSILGCEEVIDLPNSENEELVIFSNFSDQKKLEVYVYKTTSSLNVGSPIEFVKNAKVSVYAENQFLENLQLYEPSNDELSPYYKTNLLIPVYDKEYTIKIEVQGFEKVTATNSIPTPVSLESVDFDPVVTNDEDESLVTVDFDLKVTLKDPPQAKNFYHLKFYQELRPYRLRSNGDTIFEQILLKYPNNVNVITPMSSVVKYIADQSFLIEDAEFNGQTMTFSFRGQYSFNPKEMKAERFSVELRTVSEEYFRYHDTLNRQNQTNNPLGDDVVVFNNIDNGVGNFSGFASKVNTFRLSN